LNLPSENAKICLSFLPYTVQELWDSLKKCQEADIIELRLDVLGNVDFFEIKRTVDKKLIVTIRIPEEGGLWKDSAALRYSLFQQAIDAGIDYIDVEWQKSAEILPKLKFFPGTSLILSYHTEENSLEVLEKIAQQMIKIKAHIYKLIYTARTFHDNIIMLKLADIFSREGKKFIIHAMGQEGILSRLVGAIRGNIFTYVSLAEGNQTAAGQLSVKEAKDYYYLHEKTTRTKIVGLLGFPVKQSKGWRLHNRLLHEKRKEVARIADFLYVNFPVKDFEEFWREWRPWLDGLSITIPYKETIFPVIEHKASSVQYSGVCNTLVKKGNSWWGYNTDALAIRDLLKPHSGILSGGVLIYGTGATARSAIAALKELNIQPIYVSGRNEQRGQFLQEWYGVKFISQKDIINHHFNGIIQTTPLGMFPDVSKVPPITHILNGVKLVFDVIYNPPRTRFLRMAESEGCQIISGEEMFLRQAINQFKLFSGIKTSLLEVKKVLKNIC
jgi:3-dehydroquinate dehydratase/shikimate dehydrogenase